MDSRDSAKLRVFRPLASGVSRAWWPANIRRSLAAGRGAQCRRSLVLCGTWGALLARTLQFWRPFALIVASMVVGGTIVAALVWHWGYLLLIAATVLTMMTLLLASPLLLKLSRSLRPAATHFLRGARDFPLFPATRRSPKTPLPSAPLIRVLETYDLSATDVEHFLEMSKERDTAELLLDLSREQGDNAQGGMVEAGMIEGGND